MIDELVLRVFLRGDPEDAHHRAIQALRWCGPAGRLLLRAAFGAPQRPVQALGLTFPNAVGLAAGYDKDGLVWREMAALGFGHVEVGTVTPRPQAGNRRPRVFRLMEDRALINRMGFPSDGAGLVRLRLAADRPHGMVLGVNLGKNKDTPNEEAGRDYVAGVEAFADVADYLVVNVSSPNTPGLRSLQGRRELEALLAQVIAARDAAPRRPPVLVKLAPDLDEAGLDDAVEALLGARVDGVISTNTTLSRDGLRSPVEEAGGLSGAPLTARAQAALVALRRRVPADMAVIAVGGIMGPADARARLDAGATLVQLYTGFVYGGPGIVRRVAGC